MSKSFNQVKSRTIDQDDRVTFGKHAGNTWFWVMENYPDYIIWCVGNTDNDFSKELIVAAIKSKYVIKKRNTTQEVEGEYIPGSDFKFPNTPAYPSKKPAYFYDGGLRGDMAHFTATQQQEANDWDDDVPF